VALGDYMALLVMSDRNLKTATRKSYTATLKHLTAAGLASRPIGKITTDELRRFYKNFTGGEHTLEAIHKHLSKAFNAAVHEGRLNRSPLAAIKSPKATTVKPIDVGDLPTLDEIFQIADAADPRYRAAILVAAFAGLRGGEIGGLRIQDLDLDTDDPTVWIRQAVSLDGIGELKTEGSRAKLHIGHWLAVELRHHIGTYPPADDGRIFYTGNGHKAPLDSTRFNRFVKNAAAQAGVSVTRAHMLRHACASLLIQAGASVKQVQQHMRHASAEMTLDTYADLWPSDLQAIGRTFDTLVEKRVEPKALPAGG
jgi:integrase